MSSINVSLNESNFSPVKVGKDAPNLQSRWRFTEGESRIGIVVQLRGNASDILSGRHRVGETELPSGVSLSTNGKIILDDVNIEGEDGGMATETLTYRFRNIREPDSDVADGLQKRVIGTRWIERQEVIEHWAARQKEGGHGKFKAALFQAWLAEQDPATRLAYGVNLGDGGEPVALDDSSQGSALTKAVAQRYAMGVQYAGNRMLQIEVSETWREPPSVSGVCNVRITAIPENHRPWFKIENVDGRFDFVRCADMVTPAGALFARKVVYLCIPKSMKPADPPDFWGDSAVDELLNPVES